MQSPPEVTEYPPLQAVQVDAPPEHVAQLESVQAVNT